MAYKPKILNPLAGGTGVANADASTITLGGAFATSGAFSTTLTVTGSTNVTLPTTGTLATTSQIPSTPISIANGGTAASSMSTSTGIVKYDGSALVTSTTAKIDSSNRYTNTSQPAFFGYLNTTRSNVTGDGTTYNIVYDAEVYDVGSNFDTSTGVFTAPVTGKYLFTGTAFLLNLSSSFTTGILQLNTTGNSYILDYIGVGAVRTGGNYYHSHGSSILAQMTAGDTAFMSIQVSGSTKSISINSSTSPFQSYFEGVLIT